MGLTAFNILDQFRFVLELLIGEFLFALPFARRRERFDLRCTAGAAGLVLFSSLFFLWPWVNQLSGNGMPTIRMTITFSLWYILLAMLSGAVLLFCFDLGRSDLLYVMTAGYAAQHIEYVLVNELLVDGFLPQLEESLFFYALLCVSTTCVVYGCLYLLFLNRRLWSDGALFAESPRITVLFAAMLMVLIAASFAEQTIFNYVEFDTGVPVLAAVLDVLFSSLTLILLTSIGDISRLTKDRALLEQMLDEREHQYRMSAQTIEIINRKSHDLKHQIAALRHVPAEHAEASLREVERSVQIYESVIQTDNNALNTLLTEKKLLCDGHDIDLTLMVDGGSVAFLDPIDLYTLLGNALDNAIECESGMSAGKRSIAMQIRTQGRMLLIRIGNYYEGELRMRDGLPDTTKADRENHGFGMRSMRAIAERYGGTLECGVQGSEFVLQAVIPVPKG